jgi:hypothetical protein
MPGPELFVTTEFDCIVICPKNSKDYIKIGRDSLFSEPFRNIYGFEAFLKIILSLEYFKAQLTKPLKH